MNVAHERIDFEFGAVTRTDLQRRVRGESVLGELIRCTLERAVSNYLNDLEYASRSPRTIRFYEENLTHLVDRLPRIEVLDVAPDDIRGFFASRNLSKTHALHAHYRSFRAFFNWCVKQDYCARSPMEGFSPPTIPQRIKPTLTGQEIRRMLQTQSRQTFLGRRNRVMVMLLCDTGVRVAELLRLTLDDVDLRNRIVRIRKGKGNKERVVSLSERTVKEIRVYLGLDTHPGDRGVHRGSSDQLFLSEERRPLTYHGVREALITMAKLAGVTKAVSPHVFRHTWARMTLAAGVDSRYVQTLGGWASLDMVARYTKDQQAEDALRAQRAHLVVDRLL
jgi:integrase/recombinase XerD